MLDWERAKARKRILRAIYWGGEGAEEAIQGAADAAVFSGAAFVCGTAASPLTGALLAGRPDLACAMLEAAPASEWKEASRSELWEAAMVAVRARPRRCAGGAPAPADEARNLQAFRLIVRRGGPRIRFGCEDLLSAVLAEGEAALPFLNALVESPGFGGCVERFRLLGCGEPWLSVPYRAFAAETGRAGLGRWAGLRAAWTAAVVRAPPRTPPSRK